MALASASAYLSVPAVRSSKISALSPNATVIFSTAVLNASSSEVVLSWIDARREYSLYKSLSLSAFSDAVVAASILARLVSSSFSLALLIAVVATLIIVDINISPMPIGLLANMPLIVTPTSLATVFNDNIAFFSVPVVAASATLAAVCDFVTESKPIFSSLSFASSSVIL